MFSENTYATRRQGLKGHLDSGLILLLGNRLSPMNYPDNTFPFRQDSSFLYYFALDTPDLAAVIDLDSGKDIIFGDDMTAEDAVWSRAEDKLAKRVNAIGVSDTQSLTQLSDVIQTAIKKQRKIHILPPYRPQHTLTIARLTGSQPEQVSQFVSDELIKAVVAQRSYKSDEEIQQIEEAIDITYDMHIEAMKLIRPGIYEADVAAAMEMIANKKGAGISFPTILTKQGQVLHNHHHDNLIADGDLVVNDSGAESKMHYAGDITRTLPANGKFTDRQKDIYRIVLEASQKSIDSLKPSIEYKAIHLLASEVIASGLKDLGILKGDVKEIVASGAHALFFPHGLGHMMGLDVHDMENLGEDHVGYTETIKRSSQFGLSALRLAKKLEPGFVITVEPGLYFIPQLINKWKAEKKHAEFINYDKAEKYKDFGGVRIEDDLLITKTTHHLLGKPIPKTIEDIENP